MSIRFNKKHKLIVGLCLPTTLLVSTAVIVPSVLLFNKEVPEVGDFTITFDAGEGKFANINDNKPTRKVVANTPLNLVKQPQVEAEGKIFAGWKDQKGNTVSGLTKINKDTQLTASYVNANDSSYIRVSFTKGKYSSAPIRIYGNTVIAVLKGTSFFMINRPYAQYENHFFEYWSLTSDGPKVPESHEFTADTPLYPVFSEATSLLYEGNGGTLVRGNATQTIYVQNPKFKNFNQPAYTHPENKLINGWYKEAACINQWGDEEYVPNGSKAYAKWVDTATGAYITLNFKPQAWLEGSESTADPLDIEYIGNDKQADSKVDAKTWANTNKPGIKVKVGESYLEGVYKIVGWQYYTDLGTEGNWQELTDSTVLSSESVTRANAYIRPVVKKSLTDIEVLGLTDNQNVIPSQSVEFWGFVNGDNNNVKYELVETAAKESDWVTVTTETTGAGKIVVKDNLNFTEDKTFTVKVSSTIDTTLTKEIIVNLTMPYNVNNDCWIYLDTTTWGTDYDCWARVTMDSLCAFGTQTHAEDISIIPLKEGKDAFTKQRNGETGFKLAADAKLYIGHNEDRIPDNFMFDCTQFNSEVVIPQTIKTIGNDFMSCCTTLTVGPTIPKSVLSIGDGFMGSCSLMTTGCGFEAGSTITSIGEGFLWDCNKYTGVTEGEGAEAKQVIRIPDSVIHIGKWFLHACSSFCGTLHITESSANSIEYDEHNISGETETDLIYVTGINVEGDNGVIASKYPSTKNDPAAKAKFIFRDYKHA